LQRELGAEIMDSLDGAELNAVLSDLERINRWFGGESVARAILAPAVPREQPFTVLDIGAASGGMGRAITRAFPNARVVSLDRRPLCLGRADPPCVAADALQLPFSTASFDVVFCSLFLHHFEERQAAALLRDMSALARRAVAVVDLQRSRIARSFLPWTRWLFKWRYVTTHDGIASVNAAFTRAELERLAHSAGLPHAVVRSHPPWFRLSLLAMRRPNGGNGASR
jgi:SAM-dependent methyltransferase